MGIEVVIADIELSFTIEATLIIMIWLVSLRRKSKK